MKKWENSECLGDDCCGLSVFCLLVLELGVLLKKIMKLCTDLKRNTKNPPEKT